MFRNMVTSLFKYDKIQTTDVKAKELRRWADHLITLAKKGDLHAMRQALAIVREKDVVYKLFDEAKERYGKILGGYTRIIKIGRRPGDAALVSMIELVASEEGKKKKAKKSVKKQIPASKKVEAEKTEKKPIDAAAESASASEEAEAKAIESDTGSKEPLSGEAGTVEETTDDPKADN